MALPKKKPGLAVMVAVGKTKDKGESDLPSPKPVDEPDGDEAPPSAGGDEPDGDEMGECSPDPEAVCFRSEAETCQHCEYMQGNRCSHPIVAMPVQPGASCNAFSQKQAGSEQVSGQGPGQQATPGGQQVEEQS